MKKSIILLCGCGCGCGCPEVFENASAAEPQQIEIKDDFDGLVKMSKSQFSVLINSAKQGKLDGCLEA
jgi:hypothetical protein